MNDRKLRNMLEDAILGKIVNAFVDEGYRVEISNSDANGYLWVYAYADNARPGAHADRWVKCVTGNGSDFIVDYHVMAEDLLKPATQFAIFFQ